MLGPALPGWAACACGQVGQVGVALEASGAPAKRPSAGANVLPHRCSAGQEANGIGPAAGAAPPNGTRDARARSVRIAGDASDLVCISASGRQQGHPLTRPGISPVVVRCVVQTRKSSAPVAGGWYPLEECARRHGGRRSEHKARPVQQGARSDLSARRYQHDVKDFMQYMSYSSRQMTLQAKKCPGTRSVSGVWTVVC